MGQLRLTIGYLKATVVHIRVTLGHLKVTIGNFFSELHPKVRPTCILKTFECQLNIIFCLFLDLKNPGIALVTLNRGNICHVNIKRFKVWNQIFYFKYFPHLLLQLPTFDCGDIFSMLASIYL